MIAGTTASPLMDRLFSPDGGAFRAFCRWLARDNAALPDPCPGTPRPRRATSLTAHELAGGGGDVVGVDAGPGEELLARPGAWHAAHGEVNDVYVAGSSVQQTVFDSRTEAAFGAVVLGNDHAAAGGGDGRRDSRSV